MTPTAQRQQVFQSIVSGFLGRCYSVAVNVVNLQIIFASAVLACVLVALQSSFSIATKESLVLCFFACSFVVLWVCSKPLVNTAHVEFALTFGAPVLNAGSKYKVISAVGALLNRAFQRSASSKGLSLSRRFSLRFFKLSRAAGAGLLRCASGCVGHAANNTLPANKPNASLPVCPQSAWLAAPHIGGSFVNCRATIGATKSSVFGHCASRNKNARILA